MSAPRSLRGGCVCGRNRYMISLPDDYTSQARVLFSTDRTHREPLGSPLAAYMRVPLSWLQSTTLAFYSDETHSMIRRVYTHPSQHHTKRNFCGFCGTPLSYWSEQPPQEADYINLTLGSLLHQDLQDLQDLGLVPSDDDDDDDENPHADSAEKPAALTQSFGVPWFNGLVEGTRLGRMWRTHGISRWSEDGSSAQIEWEVVEEEPDAPETKGVEMEAVTSLSGKRKLQEQN